MTTVDANALRAWIEEFARLINVNKDSLTELDSAIGDADHGINMDRGMTAVLKAMDDEAATSPAALPKRTGMTLVSTVVGASGPLYGTAFLRMATAAGDSSELDGEGVAAMLRAALDGVVAQSYLGERSAGHQDPGATSVTLLLTAAGTALARDS